MLPAYQYAAQVISVHDGDTCEVNIDMGFKLWLCEQPIRLLGCNAIELKDPGGVEARDNLAGILTGAQVVLRTVKPDKYGGRMLAAIWLGDRDIVAELIASGWAAPWDGKGVKPVPSWPRG